MLRRRAGTVADKMLRYSRSDENMIGVFAIFQIAISPLR